MSGNTTDGQSPFPIVTVMGRQEFAEALTLARERAGLTVRDVARAVGVPDSTVGGYFSGRHLPPLKPHHLLPDVLQACGIHDPEEIAAWMEAARRIRRAPGRRPASAPIPYRGLSCFQPEDADWFFGREPLVQLLVERVRDLATPLMVVGASGAGKSSLLRAGLVPALRRDPAAPQVVLMTPGEHPLDELERTPLASTRVLVVDQFEEVFSVCTDETERAAFIAALCAASTQPCPAHRRQHPDIPPTTVVCGMRADFYASALRHPCLANAMQDGQVLVGPLSADEVRRVVTAPAARAKVDVEDGFVELLLRDLTPAAAPLAPARAPVCDAGTLPLLSHVLMTTWERGRHRRLTVADYRDSGGLHGAVAQSAETVYRRLTEIEQDSARRLFLRLIRVSDSGADTLRPRRHEDVVADDIEADLLDRFVASRLITTDLDTVRLSHEALLHAWPRLQEWIDSDRAQLLIGQRLADAAEVWERERRDPAALYQGSRLLVAREWLAAGPRPEATASMRQFVAAGLQRERRRTARLYRTIASLLGLLMLAAATGAVAVQQRGEAISERSAATRERNAAISRLVATRADRVREADVSLAMQLSLIAFRIAPTPEARASLLDASATPSATRMLGGTGVLQSVSYAGRRALLAGGGADGKVRLWDLRDPRRPVRLEPPLDTSENVVYTTAWSPDGHLLASGGGDGLVRLWDVSDPRHPRALPTLTGPTGAVYSVTFSPDGRTLAAGSADHKVRLWNVADPTRIQPIGRPLARATSYVQAVAFSPRGDLLAAGSDDHTVLLWRVKDPAHPVPLGAPLRGSERRIYSVAFSPDGRTLAGGSADQRVHLWHLSDAGVATPSTPLSGGSSWVNGVAFSPDGSRLAGANSDGTVRIWDLAGQTLVAALPHPGPVTAVAYTADNQIVTSAADGTARLWTVPGPMLSDHEDVINVVAFRNGETLAAASRDVRLWDTRTHRRIAAPLPNPAGAATAVAFSPDGSTMAVGSRDGTARLWDVTEPARPAPLGPAWKAHELIIESIAFSPDGRTLATGGDDNKVRLWRLTDPHSVPAGTTLDGFTSYVYTVRFSPNGKLLAAGSIDKTARLWDVSDPAHPTALGTPLTGPEHYVLSLAFSPDGRTLAMGSADKTVTLWDITHPAAPTRVGRVLDGPANYVYALEYSPDGRTLAAAITDGTVWLWDVTRSDHPAEPLTLVVPHGALYTVAFTRDGGTLAAAGRDRTVWLWRTDIDAVAAQVCGTAGDVITETEWRRYVPTLPYAPPCGAGE